MIKEFRTPVIMGILNVTPDSFSDGGKFVSQNAAVEHAMKMIDAGADIIDVGGESTRPGSDGVSETEELERVIPAIEAILSRRETTISIDTTKATVAEAALAAGATIVNDVSMLRNGLELAKVVAQHNAIIILMHSRRMPKDMQTDIEYTDVVVEVRDELLKAVSKTLQSGVSSDNIWLDPGIGFAKKPAHNLELMARLNLLTESGYPVLVGPSRKSFIEAYTGANVSERLGGTAAAIAISIYNGAFAVRVHDIELMKQAAVISAKIREAAGAR